MTKMPHKLDKNGKINLSKALPLLWVAIADSLGWGIAFSAAAALILNHNSHFLAASVSTTSRYMIYEALLAIYSVFTFLFSPVLGGISDHFGRRPALKLAMAGLTLGFILCALACVWGSIILLFVGRIISGMTAGSVSVAQAAVLDISSKETKAAYLSMMTFANCAGMSLGPVLGGFLVEWSIGPLGATTFLGAAIISITAFLLILYKFNETYTKPDREALKILRGFLNIYHALKMPIVNYFLLIFLVSMTAYGLCFSNFPLFLHSEYHASPYVIGLVLGLFGLSLSISLIIGRKYVFNRFNVNNVALVTQILQLAVYILLSLAIHQFHINCLFFVGIAILTAPLYVSLLTIISDVTSRNWQGRIMGVASSLFAIPWAVGPLLAGGFSHISATAAFGFSAILIALSLLLLKCAYRRTII